MSLKTKNSTNQPLVTQEDKQNDVIIRSIFKKIRNLTKKISDIETLEKRSADDLKPEQLDKLKSKASIVDERKKNEEFLKFYKTVITENAAENKSQLNADSNRIAQLLVLSQLIVAEGEVPASITKDEVDAVRVLSEHSHNTLAERVAIYSKTVKLILQNSSLSNKLQEVFANTTFTSQRFPERKHTHHGHEHHQHKQQQQHKHQHHQHKHQHKQRPQQQQTRLTQPIQQAPKQVQKEAPAADPIPIVVTPQVELPKPTVTASEAPVVVAETVQALQAPLTTPATPAVKQTEQTPAAKVQTAPAAPVSAEQQQQSEQNRNYNPNYKGKNPRPRPEGGYKGERRQPRQPREYKPKPRYHEKQEQTGRRDSSLSSSEEREYQRRDFNKKEINELENDGFTLVQAKPKAPARQQQGYREKKTYVRKD